MEWWWLRKFEHFLQFFPVSQEELNVYVENNNIFTTGVAVETHMVQVQIPAAKTAMIEDPSVLWMGLEQ